MRAVLVRSVEVGDALVESVTYQFLEPHLTEFDLIRRMANAGRSSANAQKRGSDASFAQRNTIRAAGEPLRPICGAPQIASRSQDAHRRRGMGQEITTSWLEHDGFSMRQGKRDGSIDDCNARHERQPEATDRYGNVLRISMPTLSASKRCPSWRCELALFCLSAFPCGYSQR